MPDNSTLSYFEHIYDRYAAVMYGCILRIVKETQYAEIVLRSVFAGLAAHSEETKLQMKGSSFWHIKYAMQKAFAFLKDHDPAAYAKAVREVSDSALSTERHS